MTFPIALHEPQWWIDMILFLNSWMHAHYFFTLWIPVLADVFVFVYPVYLIWLYVYGLWHRDVNSKEAALYIVVSTFFTICLNIVIQSLVSKQRPDMVLDVVDKIRDAVLLHKYLPTSSFPSDHAAVSMAVAVSSIAWGVVYKKPWYTYFGILLVGMSLIMSLARITTALHWPTDVLVGSIFGIGMPLFILRKPIWIRCKKRIVHPLIRLQVWLWGVVGLKS